MSHSSFDQSIIKLFNSKYDILDPSNTDYGLLKIILKLKAKYLKNWLNYDTILQDQCLYKERKGERIFLFLVI